ncbi:helix-turn-helix domain-containing protein [Streptosporangium jomthongense]|uniref:Helix-turn-helix domain-containing protein n=1 Tax=Streptosporangium jomthongense TaxID=1193683 RepID=A0ABV8FGD1_9ACTN
MAEYDPEEVYVTTKEAAELCGVKPAAVRQWVRRGHLAPVDRDERGQMLFTQLDVAKAEYKTRKHARRSENVAA